MFHGPQFGPAFYYVLYICYRPCIGRPLVPHILFGITCLTGGSFGRVFIVMDSDHVLCVLGIPAICLVVFVIILICISVLVEGRVLPAGGGVGGPLLQCLWFSRVVTLRGAASVI